MAANKELQSVKASIKLKSEMGEDGKQKYVSTTLSNIKGSATPENIHAVLEGIAVVKRLPKADSDAYTVTEKNLLQNK